MSLTGVSGQRHNLQRPEEEDDECEVLLRRMPMKHELSHGAETLIDSPYLQELVPIDRDASTSDMSIAAIRGSVDRAQLSRVSLQCNRHSPSLFAHRCS